MTRGTPSPSPATDEVVATFRALFYCAVMAGLAAGIVLSLVQATRVWPLIVAAEVHEVAGHQHAHAATELAQGAAGLMRPALTVLFNILAGLGFGLILNALARLNTMRSGHAFTPQGGIAWGVAGFAAASLAPAFALPPELPGMESGALLGRQIWWVATASCTAGGIAWLAYAVRPWRSAGIVLIVLPHLIGAPQATGHGNVPGEMAAAFAASSLAASAVFWVVLGWVSGWAQQRFAAAP